MYIPHIQGGKVRAVITRRGYSCFLTLGICHKVSGGKRRSERVTLPRNRGTCWRFGIRERATMGDVCESVTLPRKRGAFWGFGLRGMLYGESETRASRTLSRAVARYLGLGKLRPMPKMFRDYVGECLTRPGRVSWRFRKKVPGRVGELASLTLPRDSPARPRFSKLAPAEWASQTLFPRLAHAPEIQEIASCAIGWAGVSDALPRLARSSRKLFSEPPTRPSCARQTISHVVTRYLGLAKSVFNPKCCLAEWESARLSQAGRVGGSAKSFLGESRGSVRLARSRRKQFPESGASGRVTGDCLTRPIAQEIFF